jgi:hypothetical protein
MNAKTSLAWRIFIVRTQYVCTYIHACIHTCIHTYRERVLFIGTQFSNLYTYYAYIHTYIHMNVIRSACSKVILIYRDVKTCTKLCVMKSVYIARTHAHTWYASLARWEKYFLFFPSLFHGKNNGWTYLGRNIYVRTYIHAYIHANNFDDECSQ